MHLAVDTLSQLLTLLVISADEHDRAQVAALAEQVQEVTGETVTVAFVDHGYTGEQPAEAAQAQGIRLEVIMLPWRSEALCFCRSDGSSNGVLAG